MSSVLFRMCPIFARSVFLSACIANICAFDLSKFFMNRLPENHDSEGAGFLIFSVIAGASSFITHFFVFWHARHPRQNSIFLPSSETSSTSLLALRAPSAKASASISELSEFLNVDEIMSTFFAVEFLLIWGYFTVARPSNSTNFCRSKSLTSRSNFLYILIMNPIKSVIHIISIVAFSLELFGGGVDVSSKFSYINEGMPEQFKVGQSVSISFDFDESAKFTTTSKQVGLDFFTVFDYADAIGNFSFSVSEADFAFSSAKKSALSYDSQYDKFSFSVDGGMFGGGGKKLVGMSFDFVNDGSATPDRANPIAAFGDYKLGDFSLSFYDEASKTITSGSVADIGGANIKIDFSKSETNLSDLVVGDMNSFLDFVNNGGTLETDFEFTDESFSSANGEYVKMGDTWLFVAPVPEPQTYAAIFGAIALAAVCLRLRK